MENLSDFILHFVDAILHLLMLFFELFLNLCNCICVRFNALLALCFAIFDQLLHFGVRYFLTLGYLFVEFVYLFAHELLQSLNFILKLLE